MLKLNSNDFYFTAVATAQTIDSTGEIVKIEGMDLTEFHEGKAWLNWEHAGDSTPGHNASQVVGKVVAAKKIFKESECENKSQRDYWEKVKVPYIWIVGRLLTSAGHQGARDLAALMRDQQKNKEDTATNLQVSIEGSTINRKGNELTETIARRLAITTKAANKACHVDVIYDGQAPEGYDKYPSETKAKTKTILEEFTGDTLKSEKDPMFAKLGPPSDFFTIETADEDKVAIVKAIFKAKLVEKMQKALSAGGYNGAPSSLTGGSALMRETFRPNQDQTWLKNRFLAAVKDYGQEKPFSKEEFRIFLKNRLNDVDDSYIDHFTNLLDDFKLKEKMKKSEMTPLYLDYLATEINLGTELCKNMQTMGKKHLFGGHRVEPGLLRTNKARYGILHDSPTHLVVVPADKIDSWMSKDLKRISKDKEHIYYKVLRPVKVIPEN